MGLPKQRRLRRKSEFRRVVKDGIRSRDALLSITAVDNQNPALDPRYGFAIPKRVGTAVTRNRVKRRLRAIVERSDHPRGWDFVIYAFPPARDADYAALTQSVERLVRRIRSGRRARPVRGRKRRR